MLTGFRRENLKEGGNLKFEMCFKERGKEDVDLFYSALGVL
jgi:hypothetical protein